MDRSLGKKSIGVVQTWGGGGSMKDPKNPKFFVVVKNKFPINVVIVTLWVVLTLD